jgi:hypothetical protein
LNSENEVLLTSQRELTEIRKEVEQLRPMQSDLDILRSDNKRYLEKVFYFVFTFHLSIQPLFLDTRSRESTTGLPLLRILLLVLTYHIS